MPTVGEVFARFAVAADELAYAAILLRASRNSLSSQRIMRGEAAALERAVKAIRDTITKAGGLDELRKLADDAEIAFERAAIAEYGPDGIDEFYGRDSVGTPICPEVEDAYHAWRQARGRYDRVKEAAQK